MKKALKIVGYLVVAVAVVVAAGVVYLRYTFPKVDAAPVITIEKTPALVERGKYLANHVAVCIDCHSTRDWSRFSGPITPGTFGKGGDVFDHAMGFPGTFYARNITSDKETGIGAWTDGEIYRAITSGVNRNGEPLFPVMPYKGYANMTTTDAYAIVAYIRSLAPIRHAVPESKADFPMNLIMRTIPSGAPTPTDERTLEDEVVKGKYLLTVAGCTDCHTPQEKGAPIEGKHLAGGFEFRFPNGAIVRSTNITPDKQTGIGSWTEDAFVQRFKNYDATEAKAAKLGPDDFNTLMPWSMYAGMKEEDLRAIYKYLMSLEPNSNKVERYTAPAPSVQKDKRS
jgi:mono/diheme cytochrome c family protein